MILISVILIVFISLFEISFREIIFLEPISLLFITVIILFWNKRYKLAFIIGVASSILVDIFEQEHLGITLFSLYFPLFLLNLFDNIIRIENNLSKILFSVFSLFLVIFLREVLFKLLFLDKELNLSALWPHLLVGIFIILFINLVFGGMIYKKENKSYL